MVAVTPIKMSEKMSNGLQAAAIFNSGWARALGLRMKYAMINRI